MPYILVSDFAYMQVSKKHLSIESENHYNSQGGILH